MYFWTNRWRKKTWRLLQRVWNWKTDLLKRMKSVILLRIVRRWELKSIPEKIELSGEYLNILAIRL